MEKELTTPGITADWGKMSILRALHVNKPDSGPPSAYSRDVTPGRNFGVSALLPKETFAKSVLLRQLLTLISYSVRGIPWDVSSDRGLFPKGSSLVHEARYGERCRSATGARTERPTEVPVGR
jgi:hypothetical protein